MILQIEGSGGLDVPYLGYVETHLKIPGIKAFDNDVLLLIVPDSVHTHHTPIILGTPHIDMAIKLAAIKELKNLHKQWKRSLIATKLTMKEAQLVSSEDAQIVSKMGQYFKNCHTYHYCPIWINQGQWYYWNPKSLQKCKCGGC